jgi:DNA-binding NarL/FixJ family response regulator|tara:strand:+ start:183 stop:692 length:510 start_codon:yes stop_codon:yes gene_type:complete
VLRCPAIRDSAHGCSGGPIPQWLSPVPTDSSNAPAVIQVAVDAFNANIHSLKTDTHQLVERTVFTANKKCFSLTTLPLPNDDSGFITIIKKVLEETAGEHQSPQLIEANKFGERTQQALDLLVRGYSNKLIAKEMGVSENTVKDHIRRIYRHYGVSNRTELTWRLRRHQ